MPRIAEHDHELDSLHSFKMEEDEAESEHAVDDELLSDDDDHRGADLDAQDPLSSSKEESPYGPGSALDRRTKRKLDGILLPFLALLFLLNSIDKSNVGNAETAGFTRDAGLEPSDLNASMACFFAVFVGLQPVGAALGRKLGMVRWVPACMTLWGCCTLLHIWVRTRWQLITLRVAIATLEAGFYPTTVAYLSLFYTRYEFGVRLALFYGQTAVAGVIGGVLSWAVFSRFDAVHNPSQTAVNARDGGWKGWQLLFLIEGCMTIFVALVGFFWLPRSADSAWFFTPQEKRWAEQRIHRDYRTASIVDSSRPGRALLSSPPPQSQESPPDPSTSHEDPGEDEHEAHHRLLGHTNTPSAATPPQPSIPLTASAGLSEQDIFSAILSPKIWHILLCNILSAIPATAFSVFLPLVMKQLSPSLNLRASESNLLAAPPFAFGAIMLFLFARWSDSSRRRLIPVLAGLALLIAGLTVTVLVPMTSYVLRYAALCILLSGAFIASPLTVAWITNNTPEPGKRAVLLGINGWGNLGGVFLSVLFTPEDRKNGYVRPFIITLLCALASFAGYVAFWLLLLRENKRREEIVRHWSVDEKEREERYGDVPTPLTATQRLQRRIGVETLKSILGMVEGRVGDEKMTFKYGL